MRPCLSSSSSSSSLSPTYCAYHQIRTTCEAVRREAPHQLGIPEHELAVEGLSKATFLLRFGSLAIRNTALSVRAIQVGSCGLSIMTWSRRIGATVGRLRYRARVCLEGVPRHARNATAVAQLFSNPSFVDEIDCPVEKMEAHFCFNVWVWIDAPNDLALQGKLQLQEPPEIPDEIDICMDDYEPPLRDAPLKTFDYDVLIHLDQVLDYSPPSASPGRDSFESDVSGIPSFDLPGVEYPEVFNFTWYLGVRDGDRPQQRVSVHDRLGRREDRRDRSPPRGGNGGDGLGLRQWPPLAAHAVARMQSRERNYGDGGGSSSGHGGRRRAGGVVTAGKQVWRPKVSERFEQELPKGKVKDLEICEPEISFPFGEKWAQELDRADPMLDEVAGSCQGSGHPNASQCSVEPPATDRGPATFGCPHGETGRQLAPVQDGDETVHVGRLEEMVHAGRREGTEQIAEEQNSDRGIGGCARENLNLVSTGPFEELIQSDGVHLQYEEDLGSSLPNGQDGLGERLETSLGFDLNVDCTIDEGGNGGDGSNVVLEAQASVIPGPNHLASERTILGNADGRINKDQTGSRPSGRGMARFAAPLKKALLCNPPMRSKTSLPKKLGADVGSVGTSQQRRQAKAGQKSVLGVTVDEQAAAMLMKTAGVLEEGERISEEATKKFGEKLAVPLHDGVVGDMRIGFGLPDAGGRDALSGLLSTVTDEDLLA